jgi:hypothetical protein
MIAAMLSGDASRGNRAAAALARHFDMISL